MKEVKLHKLETQNLIVADEKGVFEFLFGYDDAICAIENTSPTEFYKKSVDVARSPIKQVIVNGKKFYHCFDPKLDKIMKSYYGVYGLESEVAVLRSNISSLKKPLVETQERELETKYKLLESCLELDKYRNLSLWERIVFLFKGDI
jgi:hypothetical protein